jgi:proteasome lid subunit RPN8/RPN11
MRAQIARAALEEIVAHARAEAPSECCGLLLGTGLRIAAAARTANIASNPYSRFQIDPKQHIDIRRDARVRGVDVVGFYHSHPRSPAMPSTSDLAEASYPGHLYLIVSLASRRPAVSIYRLDDSGVGNFQHLPLVTVG